MTDRRSFLKGLGGLAAASMLGCSEETEPDTLAAFSGPWGAPHPAHEFALLPESRRPEGVLEVFTLGGMTPWETFYAVPEHGDPARGGSYAGQQWWGFQNPSNGISVPDWFNTCGGNGDLLLPWSTDSAGRTVNLGPFIHPLRDRPDILRRMRVWVMAHDVEPHEIGIPLAVTGHRLGNPRMASFGAHVERYFQERAGVGRTAPHSYSVYMSALRLAAAAKAASQVGLHRASARPLEIMLSANSQLPRQLPRPSVTGYKTELDTMVQHYAAKYRGRLSVNGALPRSPGLADYEFARNAMLNHEVLTSLLPESLLSSIDTTLCLPQEVPGGPGNVILDEVDTGLRVAAHLLTQKTNAARYVQFMDSGIYTDPAGQGYDAHGAHVIQSAPNLVHMLRSLVNIVNEPGENNPSKLDLDKHFVMLNTEFGRAPFPEVSPRNPHGGGTDHWPWGYVVVGFGSFVDEERKGVIGSIGENGRAEVGFSPSEHRAALMLAMGMWPFTEQSFAVRDVRGAETELEAALWLREKVLGYPV
ncbi:MAG: hypothetical protein ACI9OJ_001280 [Myxococcota bacterium]|jgi:hypothetical protein